MLHDTNGEIIVAGGKKNLGNIDYFKHNLYDRTKILERERGSKDNKNYKGND